MNLQRIIRHLVVPPRWLWRGFSKAVLDEITREVSACEKIHGGEIRVAIEGELSLSELWVDRSVRDRALEVFALLRVWDTRQRNGVLIYLCLADRATELVADRGLHDLIPPERWQAICFALQQGLGNARGDAKAAERAVCSAIREVSALLAAHFPRVDGNELPDRPAIL